MTWLVERTDLGGHYTPAAVPAARPGGPGRPSVELHSGSGGQCVRRPQRGWIQQCQWWWCATSNPVIILCIEPTFPSLFDHGRRCVEVGLVPVWQSATGPVLEAGCGASPSLWQTRFGACDFPRLEQSPCSIYYGTVYWLRFERKAGESADVVSIFSLLFSPAPPLAPLSELRKRSWRGRLASGAPSGFCFEPILGQHAPLIGQWVKAVIGPCYRYRPPSSMFLSSAGIHPKFCASLSRFCSSPASPQLELARCTAAIYHAR